LFLFFGHLSILQLSEQIIPLQQRKKKRETDRQRNRSHMQIEGKALESALNLFDAELERLKHIDASINLYEQSDGPTESARLKSRMDAIRVNMETAKEDIGKLQPDLVEKRKAVDDRERHKKQLQQNIDILTARERIKSLSAELDELAKERDSIEGSETAEQDLVELGNKKSELLRKKAHSDGMFSSHMEHIIALKVGCNFVLTKLSSLFWLSAQA
jgi:small-conductance mechanosensitive channel